MYLLDTNHVSHFLMVPRSPVGQKLLEWDWSKIGIPFIVAGEILYGAHHSASTHRERNIQACLSFLKRWPLLLPTTMTHEIYGALKAGLRRTGKLVPDNDLWIAALTKERGGTLVTDDGDFKKIEGLPLENWLRKAGQT